MSAIKTLADVARKPWDWARWAIGTPDGRDAALVTGALCGYWTFAAIALWLACRD